MALDQDNIGIPGFEGEITEIVLTFDSLDYDGVTATANLTLTRNGDSAVISESTNEMFVNGAGVDSSATDPGRGGRSFSLAGPASPGDTIEVMWSSTQFTHRVPRDVHELQVTTTVPADDGGNGGGGNGDNGGDGNGDGNGNGNGDQPAEGGMSLLVVVGAALLLLWFFTREN